MFNFIKYSHIQKILFQLDAERAHDFAISCFKRFPHLASSFFSEGELKPIKLKCGLSCSHNIGLAAGLDKNGECLDFFSLTPFGAIEIGTVTPKAQIGNPKPRLFRLKEQKSLRNSMGFNNHGASAMRGNLQSYLERCKRGVVPKKCIGVNLGKNKDVPNDQAWSDYLELYKMFYPLADYLVINISSPNTKNLRDLLVLDEFIKLVDPIMSLRKEKTDHPPLFLKVSPDMSDFQLAEITRACASEGLSGLIATNTTANHQLGAGGLSGNMLKVRAREVRQFLLKEIDSKGYALDLIGVGGMSCFEDFEDFFRAGGLLAQVYTGFIYRGPAIFLD